MMTCSRSRVITINLREKFRSGTEIRRMRSFAGRTNINGKPKDSNKHSGRRSLRRGNEERHYQQTKPSN